MPAVKRRRSRSNRPAKKRMSKKFMQNYARKQRKSTTRIKKTLLNLSETKYKSFDVNAVAPSTSNTATAMIVDAADKSFRNNRILRMRLWDETTNATNGLWPQPGYQDSGREGDRIMCTGIRIRGVVEIPQAMNGSIIKVFYLPYNTNQGDPQAINNLFHAVTGGIGSWPVCALQTKRWPGIRYLGRLRTPPVVPYTTQTVDTMSDSGTTQRTRGDKPVFFKFWIPLKKAITFLHDTSTSPANMPMRGEILIMSWADMDVSQGTVVGKVADCTATLYWKDI